MDSNEKEWEESLRRCAQKDGVTHISCGIAVVRDNKILAVRRAQGDFLAGNFELPGGGIDEGETIVAAAKRELKEETGLEVFRLIKTFDGFDYSTDKKPKARQINFLVEAKPGRVLLDPMEHDAFLWVDENNVDSIKMSENMAQCFKDALAIRKSLPMLK